LKALSLIAYGIMISGVVGLILIHSLFSANPFVIKIQIAAVALLIWARLAFGKRSFHALANPTEGGLVTSGPYQFIRHPIYTAVALFTVIVPAMNPSGLGLLFLGMILASGFLRIHCEEKLVTERYPEYRDYKIKTWRMIPYVF
jgi:protein-S-isoprenylcysteine O-methyltransferase Ste14